MEGNTKKAAVHLKIIWRKVWKESSDSIFKNLEPNPKGL